MTENKVEQHKNKTVPDDFKIYIDKDKAHYASQHQKSMDKRFAFIVCSKVNG